MFEEIVWVMFLNVVGHDLSEAIDICGMTLRIDERWNIIQLNFAYFSRRAYGTNYVETLRVEALANCQLMTYVSDHLYSEEDLPPEF